MRNVLVALCVMAGLLAACDADDGPVEKAAESVDEVIEDLDDKN